MAARRQGNLSDADERTREDVSDLLSTSFAVVRQRAIKRGWIKAEDKPPSDKAR
jgi:hypothetical protein